MQNNDCLDMANSLAVLKKAFVSQYDGSSHIQEILPAESTESLRINHSHLQYLHTFARNNPIYHNSFQMDVHGVPCMVYEGDINSYWLDSIKHNSSCQPFYPTWILSAYISALNAKNLDCVKIVDVGSGDGRIAYCARILGLDACSIEIDGMLAKLQRHIAESTGVNFKRVCADATEFDYSNTGINTAFFIGGLPQMGGDMLADATIKSVLEDGSRDPMFVFAGSHAKKNLSSSAKNGGWDALIKRHSLKVVDAIMLPTVWTFDQKIDTPYIFTRIDL